VDRKQTVRRFVDEAVNAGRDEVIDELFTDDMATWAREWFGAFRRSFPDVQMELLELVAEGDRVVARFACSATHSGDWRGHPPTGRRFERVDEIYFFAFAGERISAAWGIEDTLERFRQLGLNPAAG
jgi:predicted ester cyclase